MGFRILLISLVLLTNLAVELPGCSDGLAPFVNLSGDWSCTEQEAVCADLYCDQQGCRCAGALLHQMTSDAECVDGIRIQCDQDPSQCQQLWQTACDLQSCELYCSSSERDCYAACSMTLYTSVLPVDPIKLITGDNDLLKLADLTHMVSSSVNRIRESRMRLFETREEE